ncbi:MAG: hypothetical protein GY760_26615 [Deltaproteobacteria bacterium]|nr:hypothetical protein [Deltaproteobacteria bacterium]
MKVANIVGSPRIKSNGAKIFSNFCDTIDQNERNYSTHIMNKVDYKGCYACKKERDVFVLKDDLKADYMNEKLVPD